MSDESRYTHLAAVLSKSLDLQQPPIAISFTDSSPNDVNPHGETVPAGCRFWQDGATRAFVTGPNDHSLCSIGGYTHNLESSPSGQIDLMDALKVFAELDYVTADDLKSIPVLAARSAWVVYAPLASTPLPPDVVLLMVDARQTLILCEAAQQVEQRSAPAMGRPACAVVPQVMNTGRAAVSLGCCGARAYLDVLTDTTSIFALPGRNLEAYVQRVEALANANEVLSKFHQIRRHSVEAGQSPSIQQSLAQMASSQ